MKSGYRYNPTIGKLGKLGEGNDDQSNGPDGVIGERA
jgi:hypothetical protein